MPPFGGVGTTFDPRGHLHFAQITDMHLSTQRRCLPQDLRDDLARILDASDLDFIIASGDLTASGKPEEFDALRRIFNELPVPVYPAPGNHDDDSGVDAGAYLHHLGPLHYSTDIGPLHLVMYDGEAWQREGLSAGDSQEAFPWIRSSIDTWLDTDLAEQPENRPILVVNHFPWGDELYARLHQHRIIGVLSGHWHSSRRYLDTGGITHYATPTLCFGGIDQTPRGYRVFSYSDDELRCESRTLTAKTLWPGVDTAETSELGATSSAPTPNEEWPQFHGGPRRTGSLVNGPAPELRQAWSASVGGGIHTAAPVLHQGRLIQTTWDDDDGSGAGVTALDAVTGDQQWKFSACASIRHSAACMDECAFALTITGKLVALDHTDGTLHWAYDLPHPGRRWVYSSPLTYEGRIFAGVSSHFAALDAESGAVDWVRDDLGCEDWISSYPSPATDGQHLVLAFYSQPTSLVVLDLATGATIWQRDGEKTNYVYSTPVIGDEVLYAVSGSAIRCLSLSTGDVHWECPVSLQRIQTTPALTDDRLILSTGKGEVHAVAIDTGRIMWTWQVETHIPLFTPYLRQGPTTLSSPVVAGDHVWVSGADGYVYCLSLQTGALEGRLAMNIPLGAAPLPSGDALWIGATDGTIRCLCA
jgi:outer membrane protein assembly factor BamB